MKRLFALLCAVFLLTTSVMAYNGDTYVYITRTGECYHRDGCSYLKSRIEVTLQEAVDRGYRACSRCSPPRLGAGSASDDDHYRSGSSSYSTYSAPSYTYTPRPTQKPLPTPTTTPIQTVNHLPTTNQTKTADYQELAITKQDDLSDGTLLVIQLTLLAFGLFAFMNRLGN